MCLYKMSQLKKRLSQWFVNVLTTKNKTQNEPYCFENKNMARSINISSYITYFLFSLLFLLLSLVFFILKLLLMIYHSLKSFCYLLYCSIRQIFSCKKKKKQMMRPNSGLLNNNFNPKDKITLVIDLDNTLVHTSPTKIEKAKNYSIIDNKFYIYKRPNLDNFLLTLSQYSELIIYTASTKEYADKVIDHIDKNKLITKRYYRTDCINVGSNWYKDVSKWGYDEKRVIVIDDLPNCHLTFRSMY